MYCLLVADSTTTSVSISQLRQLAGLHCRYLDCKPIPASASMIQFHYLNQLYQVATCPCSKPSFNLTIDAFYSKSTNHVYSLYKDYASTWAKTEKSIESESPPPRGEAGPRPELLNHGNDQARLPMSLDWDRLGEGRSDWMNPSVRPAAHMRRSTPTIWITGRL